MSLFIYFYAKCHYPDCRYTECCFAECRYADGVMFNVVMLNDIGPNVHIPLLRNSAILTIENKLECFVNIKHFPA